MKEKELRMSLIEISSGNHICPTCKNFPALGETTVDWNDCEVFQILAGFGTRYRDGNDCIYCSGVVTVDNGGGYWVVRCPEYKTDEEWCAMLGIEC